jgi:hypothetical protein
VGLGKSPEERVADRKLKMVAVADPTTRLVSQILHLQTLVGETRLCEQFAFRRAAEFGLKFPVVRKPMTDGC